MKIGIIGGGIIGLMCGYILSKKHQVTILEKDELGGLTSSFKINNTYLEKYYHHFFTIDKSLIDLLKELGLQEKVIFRKSTMAFFDKKIYSFTTVSDMLKFGPLKLFERFKLGLMIFYLSIKKNWKTMDKISAEKWISKKFGKNIYELVWQPLLKSKFGNEYKNTSAAWLWGRIYPRYHSRKMGREKLGYIKNGFKTLFLKLESVITNNNGIVIKTEVGSIDPLEDGKIKITDEKNNIYVFDKVVFTPALPIFIKTTKGLPSDYISKLRQIKYQSIICLCLKLKKNITDTYWLNISDPKIKISGLVGHTNLIDRKLYNTDIVYVFRYLNAYDKDYQLSDSEIYKSHCQEIKKIFPKFNESLIESFHLAKDQYATPIFTTGYSKLIPSFTTPIDNLYLVTMAQIYPYDRNLNNSIKLAKKACELIQHS
jgi:protoporphyrinogen oxidase